MGKDCPRDSLFEQVRRAWFTKAAGLTVSLSGSPFFISHAEMAEFGGPRLQTSCGVCAVMDWVSRLTRHNQFAKHACSDPARQGAMEQACGRVLYDDWIAILKDYNFTIGTDRKLPGIRGLVLSNYPQRVLFPAANRGMITLRQRLSPFQIDVLSSAPKNLTKYHFILCTCGYRPRPVVRKGRGPKVFVYCHDHHGSGVEIQPYYQKHLDEVPDAVLTPYPSMWKRYYKIHPGTEVVFVPYQSPTFFARPVVDFHAKPWDLLLVGVNSAWAYPERAALTTIVANEIRAHHPRGWHIHNVGWESANPNLGYSRPGGKMLLNAWDAFLAQSKIVAFGQDKWGYLVSKYSEILGSGSLMLCSRIKDLDLLGVKPNVHYVPIAHPVGKKFVPQVQHILKNFEPTYSTIAKAGHEWYRAHIDQILFDKYEKDIVRLVGGK